MKFIRVAFALVILVVLNGCSLLRQLSSKPPQSAIVLDEPYTVRELFSKATFPAGEYKSLYEDNGGYCYQAPASALLLQTGAAYSDGKRM